MCRRDDLISIDKSCKFVRCDHTYGNILKHKNKRYYNQYSTVLESMLKCMIYHRYN